MSLDSVVPIALIRQLQISLRESFSLPSSDPSSAPAPPPFPSIQDAVASLDPSLDDSARCGRCRGGLLCGGVSRLCVYCGEGFKGGEAAPHEISFAATHAYKLLLESLGLDGSESVNLDPDSVEPNKERDSSKSGMILSDLLDIKLVFSPITTYATDTETETKSEPVPTTYDLNLPGIDLDAVFKETKKEAPQIKNTKVTQNQVPFANQTSATSSFAKWEPDFGSQPVNPSLPIQIPVPAPENLSKTNPKKEVSEIETQVDEEFDDWRDFAGSRAAQNMSDSVEKAGSSVESREPVKAEGGNLFGLKNVASSGLDQSGLSDPEEVTKTSPEDSLPIENRESLNADEEDLCDDWEGFTSSGRGEEGLSGAVKPESGLPEQVPVRNVEPLNHEDDLIDDSKNFTGPGVAQTGFSVHEGKTAPISGDLFTINMEKEAAHTEMLHGDADDSFDEWNDFAGSGLGQSRSSGVEEKSKSTFWDPLNPKKLEETGNMETFNADDVEPFDDWKHSTGSGVTHIKFSSPEENIQPSSQDQSSVNEIGPSDRGEILHVKFNDPFDDWKDFTDSSAVQAKLPDNGEQAEPISDAPLLISTTEQPSDNIGTSNINDDDSFDVWKDFTSSSAVQSGLPDAGEKNESGMGNSSDIFNVRPIGGAESMKDSGSIDLWSASVIGGVTNSVSNNGNTELSDGLLDFVRPSQVNGTVSIQEVKINNNDEDSSDNWLDFAAITGPTKTKSENLNLEKKGPDDLFDDWQAFTGSSQSVKPNSNPTEKESKFGELNHEDLSEDWLDFTGSSELKGSPELKAKNNGVSDGWSNFTHTNDERPESKSLSDDWQDFTSTGQVSAPVAYNAQDIDFGDFIQLSSSAGPTDHVNFDSLNGGHSDPPSFLPMPSNNILNLNSNSTVNSRTENVSDIQKFLSQMSDLSFMLKDELSIPDKPDPK